MRFYLRSCFRSPVFSGAALALAASVLVASSGCGKSQAANAQTPPPQSLSEPVRPMESEPRAAPVIPVSSDNDDYAEQKTGESRTLPTFVPPAPPPAPAAAVVPLDNNSSKAGKYHVLAKGETIYALSRLYKVKPREILAANQFKDPDHLAVGTKVYIPQ